MVGLEALTDVAHVGVLVVLADGVELHEHEHPVGALAVPQCECTRSKRGADRVDEPVQRQSRQQHVSASIRAWSAPVELVLDKVLQVVLSHSLRREMPAVCARSEIAAGNVRRVSMNF